MSEKDSTQIELVYGINWVDEIEWPRGEVTYEATGTLDITYVTKGDGGKKTTATVTVSDVILEFEDRVEEDGTVEFEINLITEEIDPDDEYDNEIARQLAAIAKD